MCQKFRRYFTAKGKGATTVIAVAFAFFLVGLIAASSLHWTTSSAAESLQKTLPASAAGSALPDSFANLVEKLGPTVVNIQVTKVENIQSQTPQIPEGPFGEFFKRFFEEGLPRFPRQFKQRGEGSGVIISSDGYILTNNHVIDGAKEVTVTLANQHEYKAEVVGHDPKTDLAVVKIKAQEPLSVATLGNSDQLRVGDWVLAIGNPFGLSNTVTAGIVSAKGRVIGAGPYDDFIQIDAPINPGNSGGPLFNIRGEMVGINTAIIPAGQGIGFAIPINMAKPLLPQLITTGTVTRGYLGVTIQTLTPELAKALKLEGRKGALVGEVLAGSPAAKAGIERGDVIVAFNGKPVEGAHDLPILVAETPVGQEATVTLLHDGVEKQLTIQVGKMPSEEASLEEQSEAVPDNWGLQLQELTPSMAHQLGLKKNRGVVITGVEPGSVADLAGLQTGDIILEVNRHPVQSLQEVQEQIARAKDHDSLLLLVQRGQGNLFVALAK